MGKKHLKRYYDKEGNFCGCTTDFVCRHSGGCDSCPYVSNED